VTSMRASTGSVTGVLGFGPHRPLRLRVTNTGQRVMQGRRGGVGAGGARTSISRADLVPPGVWGDEPGERDRAADRPDPDQDATGTMVMLELEAMTLDRVRTEVSVQYVDHNLLQADERNAEDHRFLRSACRRFGLWFSKPGNGVSHPTHMQRFGRPGATMVGSDSHTCAAGSLGMLAVGVGGVEVALAMAGRCT
jgi:aconitate hydratase